MLGAWPFPAAFLYHSAAFSRFIGHPSPYSRQCPIPKHACGAPASAAPTKALQLSWNDADAAQVPSEATGVIPPAALCGP